MQPDGTDLSSLIDVIEPASPSLWPLAPGVLILLFTTITLMVYLAYRGYVQWQCNAYRRKALAELSRLKKLETKHALPLVAALLKRVAMVAYGRQKVAALSGERWRSFLNGKGANFPSLNHLLYSSAKQEALQQNEYVSLVAEVEGWIRDHQREAPMC